MRNAGKNHGTELKISKRPVKPKIPHAPAPSAVPDAQDTPADLPRLKAVFSVSSTLGPGVSTATNHIIDTFKITVDTSVIESFSFLRASGILKALGIAN